MSNMNTREMLAAAKAQHLKQKAAMDDLRGYVDVFKSTSGAYKSSTTASTVDTGGTFTSRTWDVPKWYSLKTGPVSTSSSMFTIDDPSSGISTGIMEGRRQVLSELNDVEVVEVFDMSDSPEEVRAKVLKRMAEVLAEELLKDPLLYEAEVTSEKVLQMLKVKLKVLIYKRREF